MSFVFINGTFLLLIYRYKIYRMQEAQSPNNPSTISSLS